MTTNDDPWQAVCRECPRRILAILHEAGQFRHYRHPGGRVLCFRHDSPDAEGMELTEAQELAECGPEEGEDGGGNGSDG